MQRARGNHRGAQHEREFAPLHMGFLVVITFEALLSL
jgi:hypothetical protein